MASGASAVAAAVPAAVSAETVKCTRGRIGAPSIVAATAVNQIEPLMDLDAIGCIRYLGEASELRQRDWDEALLDSLNKYERCQNATSRTSSSGGGGGEAGETGEGNGTGSSKQASSTASSEMSGTETPKENATAADIQIDADEQSVNNGTTERTKTKPVAGNGKIPDDIPPADNDSVLEEQIRQAAINESDPVIKEKLWNEYRKYKGLPVTSKP